MRPAFPRRSRYRGKTPVARMNQEAPFAHTRRSAAPGSRAHVRTRGWVVVNDEGKPLCEPTSRDEALKLRGSAGGRIEER